MLDTPVLSWAKKYYGACIGRAEPKTFDNEDVVNAAFITEFYNPVCVLTDKTELDVATLRDFTTTFKASNLYSDYRCLAYILGHYLGDKPAGDYKWEDWWNQAVDRFLRVAEPVVALCPAGKPFISYTIHGNVVGCDEAVLLGPLERFKGRIPNLRELSRMDPTKLNDYNLEALRQGVKLGAISEDTLTTTIYCVFDKETGTFCQKPINALDERLPGYFVRRLISNLPEALIMEHSNIYEAALSFARQNPKEYYSTINELESILNQATAQEQLREAETAPTPMFDVSAVVETATPRSDVNEAVMLSFLRSNFNIEFGSFDELIDICRQSQQEPNLSELLSTYVADNTISTECSVNQLLTNLETGEEILPMTFQQRCAAYKKDMLDAGTYVCEDTTLDEFIKGVKHKVRDDIDICVEFIRTCESIEPQLRKDIEDSVYNAVYLQYPDILTLVKDLQLPDNLLSALAIAEQTKAPFVMPKISPSKDDVVDFLVQQGIPRATANDIATGTLPEPKITDTKVSDFLIAKGISPEAVNDIVKGTLPETEPVITDDLLKTTLVSRGLDEVYAEAVLAGTLPKREITDNEVKEYLSKLSLPESTIIDIMSGKVPNVPDIPDVLHTDIGYQIGHKILLDTRAAIKTEDTIQNRMDIYPIMSAFNKLFLYNEASTDVLKNLLTDIRKQCNAVGLTILDSAMKAIDEL